MELVLCIVGYDFSNLFCMLDISKIYENGRLGMNMIKSCFWKGNKNTKSILGTSWIAC